MPAESIDDDVPIDPVAQAQADELNEAAAHVPGVDLMSARLEDRRDGGLRLVLPDGSFVQVLEFGRAARVRPLPEGVLVTVWVYGRRVAYHLLSDRHARESGF